MAAQGEGRHSVLYQQVVAGDVLFLTGRSLCYTGVSGTDAMQGDIAACNWRQADKSIKSEYYTNKCWREHGN